MTGLVLSLVGGLLKVRKLGPRSRKYLGSRLNGRSLVYRKKGDRGGGAGGGVMRRSGDERGGGGGRCRKWPELYVIGRSFEADKRGCGMKGTPSLLSRSLFSRSS